MSVRYTIDQPFGLILAGGQARRLGGVDKVLLRLGSGTILDSICERFAPQVTGLALNANGDAARFEQFSLPVLTDTNPGLGPLAGIETGLRWLAEQKGQWLVTVAGDTPFVPQDLVPRLLDAAVSAQVPAAIATDETGPHPTCAIWHVDLGPQVQQALAKRALKLSEFAKSVDATTARFPGEESFFNINTPDDLARAQTFAAR